jgi:hypothetical protein
MIGSEVKHDFVAGATQEIRPSLLRLKNVQFPFDSQSISSPSIGAITSRYWRLVRLGGTGQSRVEEVAIAKAFFQAHFAAVVTLLGKLR